jgi:methionyl aminopeptidase
MQCDRPLREGDIVNVDVTAFLDGYHGDTNATFYVVNASEGPALPVEALACIFFAAP